MLKKLLTTAVATAAFAGLIASPATAAGPEDGQGCVGVPAIPVTYVCVISLTPFNALPTTTYSYIPVDVPSVCYYLDCTDPTRVTVPVPGVSPGSGYVAVLYHNGQYIPIGLSFDGGVVAWTMDAVYEDTICRPIIGTVLGDSYDCDWRP